MSFHSCCQYHPLLAVKAPTADVDEEGHRQSMQTTYAALMAACEKAGQWDLAVALFDKMSAQV